MKRNATFLPLLLSIFLGCSGSEQGPDCNSCEIQGQRVSFCENEDGTFYLASRGETIKYSADDLDAMGLNFGEMREQACISEVIPKRDN